MSHSPTLKTRMLWAFQRVLSAVEVLKLMVLLVIVVVMPPLCFFIHQYGGGVILCLLGVLVNGIALENAGDFAGLSARRTTHIRWSLLVSHLILLVLCTVMWMQPVEETWRVVPGSEHWSMRSVVASSDATWAHTTNPALIWKLQEPGQKALPFTVDTSPQIFTSGGGPAHAWFASKHQRALTFYASDDPTPIFLERPPGQLYRAAVTGQGGPHQVIEQGHTWATIDHRLWHYHKGTWTNVYPQQTTYTVCADAQQVLSIGPDHWMLGDIQTGTSRNVKPEDAGRRSMDCVAQDGALWVYDGGIFSSTLWVLQKDHTWSSPILPVRDVRVIAFDPLDTQRAVLGSWGEGVWMTTNAGASWRSLGLLNAEVRDLVVRPGLRHISVSTSNTIRTQGVYQWAGPAL